MTDTGTMIQQIQALKKGDTVVSPEGADEIVHKADSFLITQTANGKYRLYHNGVAKDIKDDAKEAEDSMNFIMGMLASLHIDPKGTIKEMIDMMKKDK